MPQVRAERFIRIDPDTAFAFSQTTGAFRLKWDPFISAQGFLDGARAAGKGVRTRTRSRLGLSMVSQYVSFAPPRSVGMTMVSGPWFFANFGGGWRFTADDGGTRAVWKYTFSCRPAVLRAAMERIGSRLLGYEIERRIEAFARACEDEALVAEFRAMDTTRPGGPTEP
ncbi:SRPBCC family protein [Pseudarthrobacter sp. NPDC058196]|uniref:SRPBCC family protein n=1 Tax=Pseudarthrobacter sp. NPDC058196 TaxID=3346376 RepID=UPI0036DD88D7